MLLNLFSMIYSVPSLALLALLILVTGLGRKTAIAALVIYNQYLLLRNFLAGLDGVDRGVVEAAAGMGIDRLLLQEERKNSTIKRSRPHPGKARMGAGSLRVSSAIGFTICRTGLAPQGPENQNPPSAGAAWRPRSPGRTSFR